ncbi:MAG: FtsQ-type POTRA domain-containing protein [Edaphobacter sp.]|uniref:cell division protein FtsQ/DivIB n=1 Tax=Edaphobacter sp. TaxID=1934404 RepID=UPI00239F12E3|nr:FtsQ-type POTRA domain-containing protein [Edaphobacter sp.]MDE1177691.1 FtsQ-type POTRA domain-containing protein [Edaphobacter sp.]
MLEAPEPEYVAKVTASDKKPAASDRSMRRDFSDFDEEYDDSPVSRRRQAGVKLRVRGGMPKSWGGRLGVLAAVLVVVGLCAAAVMVAKAAILHDDRFVIPSSSSIEVEGNSHVTRAQLLSIFGEDVERNIFRVSLDERKAELEQLPWVEHATVMRLLPNHLRVGIVERTPVAFVRQGNHIGLVDGNGVLLDMPTDVQANMQYSFPVVIGLTPSDPLSLRAARMKLYARFTSDLDVSGEKISQTLSEVDLSDPEDVRAVVADKNGEVMVHFGEENFLDRYRKFEEHLPEWRTQYPHLSSVDMRYERQVVLEMQKGTAVPVGGGEAAAADASSAAAIAAAAASKAAAAPKAAAKESAPAVHPAPVKKPAVKAKAAAKKSAPAKKTSPAAHHASAGTKHGESFWIHPKKGSAPADQGTGTQQQFHPPQVIQR